MDPRPWRAIYAGLRGEDLISPVDDRTNDTFQAKEARGQVCAPREPAVWRVS